MKKVIPVSIKEIEKELNERQVESRCVQSRC